MHKPACRTNGEKAYWTPIFAALAPQEPQIFRGWSFDRGLCDRLKHTFGRLPVGPSDRDCHTAQRP